MQLQGQLLQLAAVMTRPPPKTIFTPHCPHTKMLIYSFNLLKFPYPSHCQSTRTATSLSSFTPLSPLTFKSQIILLLNAYLSPLLFNSTATSLLPLTRSSHCHPSLLVLILNNLILQINIQIFTLSLMHFIPKEKNEWNKWKNHFVEMKGDVGMSVHEKGGKQVNATPTHKAIYNPIPISLFF